MALVLDDDKDAHKIYGDFLRSLGFHVETVSDLHVARDQLDKHNFDLLWLDLDLGRGDDGGFWLLDWMKKNDKPVDTFIVSHHFSSIKMMKLEASCPFIRYKFHPDQFESLKQIVEQKIQELLEGNTTKSTKPQPVDTHNVNSYFKILFISFVSFGGSVLTLFILSLFDTTWHLDVIFVLLVFTILCIIVNFFGKSITNQAWDLTKRILENK